jgi:hypothetical protein
MRTEHWRYNTQKSQKVLVDFLQTDVDVGFPMLRTAQITSDPEHRRSALLLKHIRDWSSEVVEREVRANLVYRSFYTHPWRQGSRRRRHEQGGAHLDWWDKRSVSQGRLPRE